MRLGPLLGIGLLAAAPAIAQTSEGVLARMGLEVIARDLSAYSATEADPSGPEIGLEDSIGYAMGLQDTNLIIGMIYIGDPQTGAPAWTCTATRTGTSRAALTGILSRPAAKTTAELI